MKSMQKLVNLMVLIVCLGGWFIQESLAKNIYNLKGTLSILPPALQELSVLHGAIAFETRMMQRVYDIGPFSDLPDVPPNIFTTNEYWQNRFKNYEVYRKNLLSVEMDETYRDMFNACNLALTRYQAALRNYHFAILKFDIHPDEEDNAKQVTDTFNEINNAFKKYEETLAEAKNLSIEAHPEYSKAISSLQLIYRDYTYSFSDYKSGIDRYQEKLESYKADITKSTPAVKLARYFFHRVPRTTSVGDFKLSEKFDAVNPVDFAEKTGQLVAIMWWYEWMLKQELTSTANVKGALKDDVKTLIEKDSWLSSFSQPLILRSLDDKKWGKNMPTLIVLAALWCKCSDNRNALKKYNEALIDTLKGKIETFMQIEEMQNLGNKEAYITTIKEKFKDKKAALNAKLKKLAVCENIQPVISALQKTFGEWQIDGGWVANSFDPANKKKLVQEVGVLTTEQLQKNNDVVATNYEKLVLASLLPLGKPHDIGYENNVNLNGKVFSDCMETVLRNFINNLAYDPEMEIFSIAHLRSVTQKEPNEGLVEFYTKNSDPNYTTNPSVHDAWATIVSNLPWVVYLCRNPANILKMRFAFDISAENRAHCRAFYNKKYGDRFVDSSDDSNDLYELEANCGNFIIVVDQLLNLGLFEGKVLSDEIVRNDFVKEYLPIMVKKLQGFTLEVDEANLNAFDDNDWQNKNHSIFKIKKTKKSDISESFEYDMEFKINIGLHGEFETSPIATLIDTVLTTISESDMSLLPDTFSMLLPPEAYKKMFRAGTQDVCAFFAHEIDNFDKVFGWVNSEETQIKSQLLLDTLLFLANRFAVDFATPRVRSLLIYRAAVNGEMQSCYQDAIKKASESGELEAIDLFKALFNKGLAFEEAIAKVSKLRIVEYVYHDFELALFEALLDNSNDDYKEKAVEIAIKIAEDCFGNPNRYVVALQLFTILVKHAETLENRDEIFKKAEAAAQTGWESSDSYTQTFVLILFQELVNKDQAFDHASAVAMDALLLSSSSHNTHGTSCSLKLFEALFKKGEGFDRAESLLNSPNLNPHSKAALEKLVKENEHLRKKQDSTRKPQ